MIKKKISCFDLFKITNSGQCFRMYQLDEKTFETVAFGKHLIIENTNDDVFKFYCSETEFNNTWYEYFDLSRDYDEIINSIPKSDIFLQKAAFLGRGIRILKQEPWETLISFIISQRKSIPAIRTSIERLCNNFGNIIENNKYAFPDALILSQQSEETLQTCALGYRTNYILKTSNMVADNLIDLNKLSNLNNDALLEKLMEFPGVGPKVANCVLLFAYHRIEAFPIDVWISRILEKEYNNNFDLNYYKNTAGIIQQYMFYYAQNSPEYKIKKTK